ncbi:MAG TPA: hypothetical protein VF897_01555 [Roseiflexaceae bacterium]
MAISASHRCSGVTTAISSVSPLSIWTSAVHSAPYAAARRAHGGEIECHLGRRGQRVGGARRGSASTDCHIKASARES